jgi:chemotaxis protein MotB
LEKRRLTMPVGKRKVISKKKPEEGGGADDWLTTYGDMMTLLMTFFVLLFSMSTIDPVKLQQFGDSLGQHQGSKIKEKKVSLTQINKEVIKLVKEQNMESQVEVTMTSRGVTLGIASDIAFQTGSAILAEPIKDFLIKVVPTMRKATYAIAVEGHTDNVPMRSAQYPSNWELSAARSSSVIRYLDSEGVSPDKFRAIGFGDTRPKVKNDTQAGRSKNRRVEITFLTIG